jgi:dipeptidyl aminopeptidase/acylaminoacyl peptidase
VRKAAGKSVELVTLDDEDGWASNARSRLETLRVLERFLARNLAQ